MTLQAILDAIHADGEAQASRIEDEARQEAEAILAQARAAAATEYEHILTRYRIQAGRERAVTLQQARQEALSYIGAAHEEFIRMVLADLDGALKDIRESSSYSTVLRRLVDEALQALIPSLHPTEQPLLRANPCDRVLLESIAPTVQVEFVLDCQGGVIALSVDESILVDNTLETRARKALRFIRRDIVRFLEEPA